MTADPHTAGAESAASPERAELSAKQRLEAALRRFDEANSQDPTYEAIEGGSFPAALVYGHRMSSALQSFAPQATIAVQLAARAQHLERWKIPRTDYAEGRKGYHAWRSDLARFHAERAGAILVQVGFDVALIAQVQSILRKERLKQDPEVQLLEDVACLVFLEHYFVAFANKHTAEKVIDVLRKTWRKMSSAGQHAALQLAFPPEALNLIQRAVTP